MSSVILEAAPHTKVDYLAKDEVIGKGGASGSRNGKDPRFVFRGIQKIHTIRVREHFSALAHTRNGNVVKKCLQPNMTLNKPTAIY